MARTQEIARHRVKPLTDGLELLLRHLPLKTKQFGTPAMPFALHRALLVIVVAMLQMPLCIALTAGHGPNRQHSMTVGLFELRMQATVITNSSLAITKSYRVKHP